MEALVAALIGVFGALVGNWVSDVRRRKREERAAKDQLRAAARMVAAEFGMAAIATESAIRNDRLWGAQPACQRVVDHGTQIALVLPDEDFAVIVEAAAKIGTARATAEALTPILIGSTITGDPDISQVVGALVDLCRHAQTILEPTATPMPAPCLPGPRDARDAQAAHTSAWSCAARWVFPPVLVRVSPGRCWHLSSRVVACG